VIRTNGSVSIVKRSEIESKMDSESIRKKYRVNDSVHENESIHIKNRINDSNRSSQKLIDLLKYRVVEKIQKIDWSHEKDRLKLRLFMALLRSRTLRLQTACARVKRGHWKPSGFSGNEYATQIGTCSSTTRFQDPLKPSPNLWPRFTGTTRRR
jgi:hypothetical protein